MNHNVTNQSSSATPQPFFEKRKYLPWVKFPIDFYEWPVIKKLRKHAGGDTYTILYQKIMLHSSQWGGCLKFFHYEENFHEELALILNENEKDIKIVLSFLEANSLMEMIAEDVYLLSHVLPMIGKEGESTERVRRFRERQNSPELEQKKEKQPALSASERVAKHREKKRLEKEICNGDVTKSVTQCNENSVTGNVLCNDSVTLCHRENVTSVTLISTPNPNEIGIKDSNVTCNVYETEVKRNGNAIEIEIELEKESGGIRAQNKPLHAANDITSLLPNYSNELINMYIEFRLSGSGITTPIAFEESLRKQITLHSSSEHNRFSEWLRLKDGWSAEMDELFSLFLSFGHSDRKMCRMLSEDFTQLHGIEVTPVMFELAFCEANKQLQHRRAV